MCGKKKTAQAGMAWIAISACQLCIEIKGAAFRPDGLTDA